MNSVLGLYLHPGDTSLMLHVSDCVIFCSNCVEGHIRYDVYENYDCVVVAQEIICMV